MMRYNNIWSIQKKNIAFIEIYKRSVEKMEEENLQGKYFSITDPKNVSTVIYQVNKTEKEFFN